LIGKSGARTYIYDVDPSVLSQDSSCVSPNYMTNQFDINERMRAILVDWLIEVHYLHFHVDVLFKG